MKTLILLATAVGLFAAPAAEAALKVGDKAPEIATEASLGGNEFAFRLSDALKTGPVVLYFYPAAFTSGCTAEAHAFADATDKFKSMGAEVIGMSHDDIDKLKRFSTSECRSKFAVGAADSTVISAYDVGLMFGMSSRTSYLIAQNGRIAAVYSALNPDQHVDEMLKALTALKATAP